MKGDSKRWNFRSALLGGLFAAIMVMAVPAGAAALANLVLGQGNFADVSTRLTGNVASSNLRLVNTHPDGTALRLQVEPGNPPLTVNSRSKVVKLNADRLDGLHRGAFLTKAVYDADKNGIVDQAADAGTVDGRDGADLLGSGQVLYASVTSGGALTGSGNAVSATRIGLGDYKVVFDRSTYGCAGTATSGQSTPGGSSNFGLTYGVYMGGAWDPDANTVSVFMWNHSTSARGDSAFHLLIVCPEDEQPVPGGAVNGIVDGSSIANR